MTERAAIVCGGRDYRPTEKDIKGLAWELHQRGIMKVIHGDARGVDRWAGNVAQGLGLDVEAVPAQWSKHGRAAGPIRNREMLTRKPVVVIAFPGGRGTADMTGAALRAGVPVVMLIPRESPSNGGQDV